MRTTHRASAKNRRLAEQMSRRTGVDQQPASSAAMDKEYGRMNKRGSVKNRIDRTKIKSNVRDRLGSNSQQSGDIQSRLGPRGGGGGRGAGRGGRGRGRGRGGLTRAGANRIGSRLGNLQRSRSTVNLDNDNRGGQKRGSGYQGRGRGRGAGRGAGRGRGRGRGRGGRGGRTPNPDTLDTELDNYMSKTQS